MCSIPKLLSATILTGLIALGCQKVEPYQTMELSKAPIHQDEAMDVRQWPDHESLYAAGYCYAEPTLFPYTVRYAAPSVETLVASPAIFVGQTILTPVWMIATPPWDRVYYRGVMIPPTYTAAPEPPDDARWFSTTVKYSTLSDKGPAARPGKQQ
jgi:hypothetical protein